MDGDTAMSTKKVLRWAREATTGSVNTKVVLLILAAHANSAGEVCHGPQGEKGLSAATIAREAEVSRRSVQRALQMLDTAGLIKVGNSRRDNGSWASNSYLLIFDGSVDVEGWCQGVATPGVSQSLSSDSHYRQGDASVTESSGLTSENSGGGDTLTLGGVSVSHLEEKIPTTTYSNLGDGQPVTPARTPAREAGNTRPTPEQLNATGVKDPRAYTILARWRAEHAQSPQGAYSLNTYRQLGPHIDAALANGKDEAAILGGLKKWDGKGSKARPELLPLLIDDVGHDQRAANDPNRAWVDRNGDPLTDPDQIPDEVLTREVIQLVLGDDTGWYPRAPREIEEESGPRYIAWMREARDTRLAERRQLVRENWAKRSSRSAS
jgi:hypothetical protein